MPVTDEILRLMVRDVPPGQQELPPAARRRLAGLTARLRSARPDSAGELRRYLAIRERTIPIPQDAVRAAVAGRRIMVTGGSGCLGAALLDQLAALGPAQLASASITPAGRKVAGVRYLRLDVRDRRAVEALVREHRPDVVFHLAAQRDPGLAEREVVRTVHTNVLGTRNVAEAAEHAGVECLVYASTGKAMRPWTPEVYAGSKRMGEWVLGQVAARGRVACGGVRFTHVVDNSIVLDRFRRWCAAGDVVRLHSPDTLFYAQSAVESAQLMLTALVEAARPVLRLCMIRDLGWPVSLLDVALGVIAGTGGTAPLYVAGHEPGYEQTPYPGLYDPLLAGEVSPLVNAMEAPDAQAPLHHPAVDVVPVRPVPAPGLDRRLLDLEERCVAGDEAGVREVFSAAAWDLFVQTVRAAPPAVVDRIVRITRPHRDRLGAEHLRMDDVFRRFTRPAPVPVSTPDTCQQTVASR
ncbi:MAG TPA: polysaccharide biosynthesis protein [Micromonosporaceae bacterium]|nr:polysaccharide biosynthesis protein [Micromonosporaceae bacterium]